METERTMIDLFAGVGGLSLGFERVGFQTILANEFNSSIANTYIRNRDNPNMIVEDIRKLPLKETFSKFTGKVTVIVGGSPCQGYSQKGKRKTIHDERNFLFRYFVDVVREVEPAYFVMENVPNLLTNEGGYFKRELFSLFDSISYTVNADVLCAVDYGVPQNRRRAFLIGKRGRGQFVQMPEKKSEKTTIWDAISDLSYLHSGEGVEEQPYQMEPQSAYQTILRKGSSQLTNHISTKHTKIALERMAMIPPKSGKEFLPPEHLTKSIYSGTWTRMDADDVSATITTRFDTPSSGKFIHPYLDRAITVREAARLQSFPDTFRFYGTKTSQMKQVGNAVPPLLAQAVAETILEDMGAVIH